MKSLLQSRLAWAILPVLAALYWIALFVATHIPREFKILQHGRDKIIHFSAFAVLGLLVALSINYWRRLSWRLTAAIIVVLALYGAIDEYLQGVLTTQRKPDWKDWVMDAMGATAGAIAAAVLTKRLSK